ncbi:FAD dependent oxidoreductase [Shimia isoporae]|uniref:FAD dependent oxidoreductase n=2 Tax=Shimia isoporae TaxID=647720 RepID=A0A4V2Q3Q0_9RHOB|nr:FAD dependent oxidoreductase [Shimia isoporae]
MQRDVLVLGAGIQGSLAALMMAQRGRRVTLVDRAEAMLSKASLNYEGRIHSGMLYAMDASFRTAERMVQDALAFAPTVERLLGQTPDWAGLRAKASTYLVHRDSHLSPEDLARFWARLEGAFLEGLRDQRVTYVGTRPDRLFRPTELPRTVNSDAIVSAFESAEVCLDQQRLNALIEAAVRAHPRIELALGRDVLAIEPKGAEAMSVSLRATDGMMTTCTAGLVVNCLWEARGLFDAAMGLEVAAEESLRLKYSVVVESNDVLRDIGSIVVTHGAFGSMVVPPVGPHAFLSWYPSCIEERLPLQPLPARWRALQAGPVEQAVAQRVLEDNVAGFRTVFPTFPMPNLRLVKAGVIVAQGDTDIDQAKSGFHRRDEYPIRQKGSYVSVATGKYTSVGRNVCLLEEAVFGLEASAPAVLMA